MANLRDDKQPLADRIRRLADDVTSLQKAIREEVGWQEKLHPVDLDDWDDDESH